MTIKTALIEAARALQVESCPAAAFEALAPHVDDSEIRILALRAQGIDKRFPRDCYLRDQECEKAGFAVRRLIERRGMMHLTP